MTQTAHIQIEEQYLRISTHGQGDIERIDMESRPELNSILENPLFREISAFYYNGKIRIVFRVSSAYATDYILLKGLIEFHRPAGLAFFYHREQRSVTADVQTRQLEELRLFLSRITEWLNQEKKFRHALKIALGFENRYKLERDGVYEILRNTTVAAQAGR